MQLLAGQKGGDRGVLVTQSSGCTHSHQMTYREAICVSFQLPSPCPHPQASESRSCLWEAPIACMGHSSNSNPQVSSADPDRATLIFSFTMQLWVTGRAACLCLCMGRIKKNPGRCSELHPQDMWSGQTPSSHRARLGGGKMAAQALALGDSLKARQDRQPSITGW